MPNTKVCTKCTEKKDLVEDFHRDKSTPDGRVFACKACKKLDNDLRRKGVVKKPQLPPGLKECADCRVVKDHKEFGKSARNSDGKYCYCKPCVKEQGTKRKQHNTNNPPIIPDYKECSQCKKVLPSDSFYRNIYGSEGIRSSCKECCSIHSKALAYVRRTIIAKERRISGWKPSGSFYCKGCERHLDASKFTLNLYVATGIKSKCKQCVSDRACILVSARRASDPDYRIYKNISGGLHRYLSKNGTGKQGKKTFDILDFTQVELREHLEPLFTEGMTHDNHGRNGWHLDHIIPQEEFLKLSKHANKDLKRRLFKMCWSLKNLQPLWAKDNLSKGDKYDGPSILSLLAEEDNDQAA